MKRIPMFFLGLVIAQHLLGHSFGQTRFDARLESAAQTSAQPGAEAEAVVAKLIQVIKSKEDRALELEQVCSEVKAAQASKQALPALQQVLQDPDADIKFMGLMATFCLELQSLLLPEIVALIKDEDAVVRCSAVEALTSTGKIDDSVAQKAIPALIEYLQYQVGKKDLPRTGPRTIVRLAGDLDDFRRVAAQALGKIGPRAVPALMEALENDNVLIREGAARALAEIGPQAGQAASLLLAATSDRDRVRFRAAVALWKVDPQSKPLIPLLMAGLQSEDMAIVMVAADTLGEIGPEAKEAVPALIEVARKKTHWGYARAATALGRIGPEAKAALPVLLEVLKGKEAAWVEAAIAIWRIDRQNKEVIPVLIEQLKAEKFFTRSDAAAALGEIGPDAIDAVLDLEQAANDEDHNVREAASKALQKIAPKAANRDTMTNFLTLSSHSTPIHVSLLVTLCGMGMLDDGALLFLAVFALVGILVVIGVVGVIAMVFRNHFSQRGREPLLHLLEE